MHLMQTIKERIWFGDGKFRILIKMDKHITTEEYGIDVIKTNTT